jgi:DNA-binding CsgD family transcriptional regulator
VSPQIEVISGVHSWRVQLEADRSTIGKAAENDIAVDDDATAMFTEPASTRAIADELVITQAAVKQHLANLYEKFGIAPGNVHRRAGLANEALRRGAVSLTELRESEPE